jgi:hypothetical protein
MYGNRIMKHVEIILRRGEGKRENNGGGESKVYYNPYINVTRYPLPLYL